MSSKWKITVEKRTETIDSRIFSTIVLSDEGEYVFDIEIDKDYSIKLFDKEVPLSLLIQHSFLFLLEREPITAVLRDFNLKEISEYFPEYEETMKALFA